MNIKHKIYGLVTVLFLSMLASCKISDENKFQPLPPQLRSANKNILEVLRSEARFSLFLQASEKAGLTLEWANESRTFTFFAPNNAAFEAAGLNAATIAGFPEGDATLKAIVGYHILNNFGNNNYRLSSSIASGALETNAPLPFNQVFFNVLAGGAGIFINGNRIIKADIPALNGVIHEIDKVLQIPSQSMYEIISADPRFSILKAGLDATPAFVTALSAVRVVGLNPANGVAPVNAGGSNFTVFAPTNDAFIAAGIADAAALVAIPAAARERILRHHLGFAGVGRVFSGALLSGNFTSQQANAPIRLTVDGSNIRINTTIVNPGYNDARVIEADIFARNGVIHAIDKVLNPDAAPAP
jgi:uncharacterized surface protein with fasciclin (FAS1) repeats